MSSTSSTKPSLVKRDSEDLQIAIRFDYSEAHLENEELDAELEDTKLDLCKAQYRSSIKEDEKLKIAKKNAEDMLSLKKATKKRPPDEAVAYLKNKSEKQKGAEKETERFMPDECRNSVSDDRPKGWKLIRKVTNTNTVSDIGSSDKSESDACDEIKPVNTLTMFVLSMQKIRGFRHQNELLKEEYDKREESSYFTPQHQPLFMNRTSLIHPSSARNSPSVKRKGFRGKRRPATVNVAHGISISVQAGVRFPGQDGEEHSRTPNYGLHAKKKDPRSRLQLEEISKIEQSNRLGIYDKFEQRRRRLLASEKDPRDLQLRIQKFLKNVDEFKKQSKPDQLLSWY